MWKKTIKMHLDVQKEGFVKLSEKQSRKWEVFLNGKRLQRSRGYERAFSFFLPACEGELVLKYRTLHPWALPFLVSFLLTLLSGYAWLFHSGFFFSPFLS